MSAPPSILATGWAIKQGGTIKTWKRRWFVLVSTGLIRYFPNKLSFDPKGEIMITTGTKITVGPTRPEGVPLLLDTGRRVWAIAFGATQEAENWKNVLLGLQQALSHR